VIDALERVDRDLSRAVVRVTQPEIRKQPHAAAELAAFGSRAVIVVSPTRTLERFMGVMLVPLSDGRALISFDETTTPARLELMIEDALEDRTLPPDDAEILASIRDLLKEARRSTSVTLSQRNIIVLEHHKKDHNGKRAIRK
jgi:cobalamin biosynthesis protein CbiG